MREPVAFVCRLGDSELVRHHAVVVERVAVGDDRGVPDRHDTTASVASLDRMMSRASSDEDGKLPWRWIGPPTSMQAQSVEVSRCPSRGRAWPAPTQQARSRRWRDGGVTVPGVGPGYQGTVHEVYSHWSPAMHAAACCELPQFGSRRLRLQDYLEASSVRFHRAYCQLAARAPGKLVCDVGGFWGVLAVTLGTLGFEVP